MNRVHIQRTIVSCCNTCPNGHSQVCDIIGELPISAWCYGIIPDECKLETTEEREPGRVDDLIRQMELLTDEQRKVISECFKRGAK